jgi:hypothetical protein
MQVQRRALCAVCLAWAAPASAEVVDIIWGSSGRFEHQLSVAPDKVAEVCGKLPAKLQVRWDFAADAPLVFNIHYHVGRKVVFATQRAAVAQASDRLHTKSQQDYCWMWHNKSSAPVQLRLSLAR